MFLSLFSVSAHTSRIEKNNFSYYAIGINKQSLQTKSLFSSSYLNFHCKVSRNRLKHFKYVFFKKKRRHYLLLIAFIFCKKIFLKPPFKNFLCNISRILKLFLFFFQLLSYQRKILAKKNLSVLHLE